MKIRWYVTQEGRHRHAAVVNTEYLLVAWGRLGDYTGEVHSGGRDTVHRGFKTMRAAKRWCEKYLAEILSNERKNDGRTNRG